MLLTSFCGNEADSLLFVPPKRREYSECNRDDDRHQLQKNGRHGSAKLLLQHVLLLGEIDMYKAKKVAAVALLMTAIQTYTNVASAEDAHIEAQAKYLMELSQKASDEASRMADASAEAHCRATPRPNPANHTPARKRMCNGRRS